MKGELKALSVENNAVLIAAQFEGPEVTERWFPLAEHVKQTYIKKGQVDFTLDETGEILTFVKSLAPATPGYSKPAYQKPTAKPSYSHDVKSPETETAIKRMSALKSSALVYGNSLDPEGFKQLTTDIVKFIETGAFE